MAHGNHRVRVVRGRDDNGVDVLLLVEHLSIVSVHFGFRVPLEHWGRVVMVHIAKRYDIFLFAAAQIGTSHAANSHTSNV